MNKPQELFEAVKSKSLPLLEAYKTDLTEHDKASIEGNVELCPFIHWTRNHGTHLLKLIPFNSGEWPAKGKRVPYLFGEATREHILDQFNVMAKYLSEQGSIRLVLFWDGTELREISAARAVELVRDYVRHVGSQWNKERSAS